MTDGHRGVGRRARVRWQVHGELVRLARRETETRGRRHELEPPAAIGIAVAVLTWLVIIGGIKSIGRAAAKLSPLKVGLYLAGGLVVILANATAIPGVIAMVFREALTLKSGLGFGLFVAMLGFTVFR